MITFLRLNVASVGESLEAAILTFQSDVTKRRYSSSVSQFLSGARQIPRVHWALWLSSRGITMWCCWSSLIKSSPGFSDCVMYCHLFCLNWKLIRYQKHLVGTRAPPVAWSKPSQLSTKCCISNWMFLLVMWGPCMHKLVSSTKANPTKVFSFLEIAAMICA